MDKMETGDYSVEFNEYMEALHEAKIRQLKKDIAENFNSIRERFIESFARICDKIAFMQSKGEKKEIAFINYSLLRTQIINNKHNYLISAYDDTWYADEFICEELYDASWAFRYLDEFEAELNLQAKKYMGQITFRDVQKIKLEKVLAYHRFVLQLARKSVLKAIETPEFNRVLKFMKFDVRVGEYFDISESIYVDDNTPKDSLKTKKLLEKKYPLTYGYEHYKNLDLSRGDYESNNFSYTVFENCNLSDSIFKNTVLRGTRFKNCNLKGSKFGNSVIIGTDFCDSELEGADFSNCNNNVIFDDEDMENPLFEKISFCNANLKGLNVSYSNMAGTDFTGAYLEGCSFKNTNLKNAIVSKRYQEDEVLFSPLQKKVIRWVD